MQTSDQHTRMCWNCREYIPEPYQMNTLEMKLARPPMPGDISICNSCGAFSVFNGLLHLEKPDAIKMRQILATTEIMEMQEAILAGIARTPKLLDRMPRLSVPKKVHKRPSDGGSQGFRA